MLEAAAGPNVELLGALPPDRVRAELEAADLLAMPTVVAGDGDRDAMPVVVKEALAMEIPVVGSDEVGMPEMVRRDWGRLVPPHSPAALAKAIRDVLELAPSKRAEMGRRGRDFVARSFSVRDEALKLIGLIERSG